MKSNRISKYSTVLIFCNKNPFLKYLIRLFRSAGIIIAVITKTDNISKNYIKEENIIFRRDYKEVEKIFTKIDYLIYVSDNEESKLRNEIDLYRKVNEKYSTKSLFLFNGIYNKKLRKKYINDVGIFFKIVKKYGLLVLYGDILSTSYRDIGISRLQDQIFSIASGKKSKIFKDVIYYPLLIDEFMKNLQKLIFSLKTEGEVIFISGRPLKYKTFIDIFKRENIKIKKKSFERLIYSYDKNIKSKKQSKRLIKKIYVKLKSDLEKEKDRKMNSLNIKRVFGKLKDKYLTLNCLETLLNFKHLVYLNKVKITFITLILFFLLPIFLITITTIFLLFTKSLIRNDYIKSSYVTANASLKISEINNMYISNVRKIPLLENYFNIYKKPSTILELQSSSTVKGIKIINVFIEACTSLYENEWFDSELIRIAHLELDSLYTDLGFLETEMKDARGINLTLLKLLIDNENLELLRKEVLPLRSFANNIYKKYNDQSIRAALVFQDSSILRPTGGLIETVFLFNPEASSVEENIIDVADIDKKLVGSIEPPLVLKRYFGEKYWYLKDYNWNPNFNISAKKIETLLSKELNTDLNVIISIDKNFVYDFYQITSNEFNKNVFDSYFIEEESNNDYPEGTFNFPLTRLIRENAEGLRKLSLKDKSKMLRIVYKALNNKNIQLFFSEDAINKDILELGWGGNFEKGECQDPCYAENISLVESSISKNSDKVNRESQLSISFEEGVLKRDLVLYLENESVDSYKAYLRLFVNNETGFGPVKIVYPEKSITVEPEVISSHGLKEAGVYVEVEPRKTIGVSYSWEGKFEKFDTNNSKYEIFWNKQAGVSEYPVVILIKTPKGNKINSNDDFTLTDDGVFIYNTSLDRDISPTIFW